MASPRHSRREFLHVLGAGSAAMLLGCGAASESGGPTTTGGGSARLTARPGVPSTTVSPGTYQITAGTPNDGVLVVPSSYSATRPMPLMLGLHGASGKAQDQVSLMGPYAEARGFLLLAVGARGLTWDVFSYKFSYDVAFIDSALKWAFARCNVDASRVAIEGFSDGATYTLGLALANGDLFSKAIAFSPGFIPASDSSAVGKASFFDSHGMQDQVLNIDTASRLIVPELRGRGYDVNYVEFAGGHAVPVDIAKIAVEWFMV